LLNIIFYSSDAIFHLVKLLFYYFSATYKVAFVTYLQIIHQLVW